MQIPCTKGEKCSLLFVEDEDSFVQVIESSLDHLTTCGFEITRARTKAEALEKLTERRFDVSLADLSLPDAGGTQIVDALLSATGGRLPVVVLTGIDDEELGCDAITRGAQSYVPKSLLLVGRSTGREYAEDLCARLRHAILRTPWRVKHIEQCERLQAIVDDINRREAAARAKAEADKESETVKELRALRKSITQVLKAEAR